MLAQKILRSWGLITSRRCISHSSKNFESKAGDSANKASSTPSSSSASTAETNSSLIGVRVVAPKDWEKWLLVWMKRYPEGQVPNRVSAETMHQTKSRARIRVANYMIVLGLLMCAATVYSGKQAAKRGDSIQKRYEEWHKKENEEYKAKLKEAESSKSL